MQPCVTAIIVTHSPNCRKKSAMLITSNKSKLTSPLPVAELMLIGVAFFWGTSYGLTKEVLVYTSVLGFLAIRFLITFAVLIPTFISDFRNGLTKDWGVSIPTGLILLSIFIAETYGVANTTASNAAFLISLCVVITPFIEWLVYKKHPGKSIFWLSLTCLLGVFLLTLNDSKSISFNQGDFYILIAALLRACMVVATKKLMFEKQLSSISLTMLQSGVVGFGALFILLLTSENQIPSIPTEPSFWLITLYLVLFCTIFAFFAQNYGVRKTSPSKVSLLMGSEPAFGAAFAVIWLGENLSWYQYLGGGLIVIATLLVATRKDPQTN